MTRKEELLGGISTCAVFAEYVKDHTVDLGRILATTRTLLASWALVAALGAAMLLAPAVAHGTRYAEARTRHAVERMVAHRLVPGHGPELRPAARTSMAG